MVQQSHQPLSSMGDPGGLCSNRASAERHVAPRGPDHAVRGRHHGLHGDDADRRRLQKDPPAPQPGCNGVPMPVHHHALLRLLDCQALQPLPRRRRGRDPRRLLPRRDLEQPHHPHRKRRRRALCPHDDGLNGRCLHHHPDTGSKAGGQPCCPGRVGAGQVDVPGGHGACGVRDHDQQVLPDHLAPGRDHHADALSLARRFDLRLNHRADILRSYRGRPRCGACHDSAAWGGVRVRVGDPQAAGVQREGRAHNERRDGDPELRPCSSARYKTLPEPHQFISPGGAIRDGAEHHGEHHGDRVALLCDPGGGGAHAQLPGGGQEPRGAHQRREDCGDVGHVRLKRQWEA
mmetsp:Transcript_15436/g.37389  ORF Transcript_15436/g.37389 Transcript_15436/m.37389 type:complete len:347 (+) Transcript_15436:41-1081(+)